MDTFISKTMSMFGKAFLKVFFLAHYSSMEKGGGIIQKRESTSDCKTVSNSWFMPNMFIK